MPALKNHASIIWGKIIRDPWITAYMGLSWPNGPRLKVFLRQNITIFTYFPFEIAQFMNVWINKELWVWAVRNPKKSWSQSHLYYIYEKANRPQVIHFADQFIFNFFCPTHPFEDWWWYLPVAWHSVLLSRQYILSSFM